MAGNHFFFKQSADMRRRIFCHPDLADAPGDSQNIRQCKIELRSLLSRPDGFHYQLCEFQRIIQYVREQGLMQWQGVWV